MKRRTLLALASSTVLLAACNQSPTTDADTNAADSAATGGSDLLQRINNGGTINVGTEGTYPPFTYHDESGKLTDYDVEVTRAVADKLGVSYATVNTYGKRIYEKLHISSLGEAIAYYYKNLKQ